MLGIRLNRLVAAASMRDGWTDRASICRSRPLRRSPTTSAPAWGASPAASGSSVRWSVSSAPSCPAPRTGHRLGPGLGALVLAYGIGSVTGLIPWERASLQALAIGMVVTVPVVGLAIYMTGGSISYIEPLLACSLLYAALFFPAALGLAALDRAGPRRRRAAALRRPRGRNRLHPPLHGARLRLPRRHLGDGQPQEPAGAGRGAPAPDRQPRPADRDRQPPRLRRRPAPRARGAGGIRAAAARGTRSRWRC